MLRRAWAVTAAATIVAAALAGAACGPKAPSTGQFFIYIPPGGGSFNPSVASVATGTLVTWINQDTQPHSATAPGAFDSGPIPPNGGQWSWVASLPGQSVDYQDMIGGKIAGRIDIAPVNPGG